MTTLYKISQILFASVIEDRIQNPAAKSGDPNSTTLFTSMKPYHNNDGPDDQRQVCQDVDSIKGDAESPLY